MELGHVVTMRGTGGKAEGTAGSGALKLTWPVSGFTFTFELNVMIWDSTRYAVNPTG